MARNALETDPAREQRVRERAYHLWESDGKPHGRDIEYWERARELIAHEESAEPARNSQAKAEVVTNASSLPEKVAKTEVDVGESTSKRKKSAEAVDAQPPAKGAPEKSPHEAEAPGAQATRKRPARKKK